MLNSQIIKLETDIKNASNVILTQTDIKNKPK